MDGESGAGFLTRTAINCAMPRNQYIEENPASTLLGPSPPSIRVPVKVCDSRRRNRHDLESRLVRSNFYYLYSGSAKPESVESEVAQSHAPILIPATSIEQAEDVGVRAHTNHLIRFEPDRGGTSPSGLSPATLRSVYSLPSTGGGGTIAIVDAFHYATAENDLSVFSTAFGLPQCTTANGCFKQVYASGSKPRANCGWAQETALDIEWAHAMAPNAEIVLVEAATNSFANLFAAVDVATAQVTANGGHGQVSMSWSGSEFSAEASNDSHFQNNNVIYSRRAETPAE